MPRAFPVSLTNFKPTHVLSYVQQLAAQQALMSRMAVNGRMSNAECYQKSSAALIECANKAEEGNFKCENILNVAQAKADDQLEQARKSLDIQSKEIQSNLNSCKSSDSFTAVESLECYETQVCLNIQFFFFNLVKF